MNMKEAFIFIGRQWVASLAELKPVHVKLILLISLNALKRAVCTFPYYSIFLVLIAYASKSLSILPFSTPIAMLDALYSVSPLLFIQSFYWIPMLCFYIAIGCIMAYLYPSVKQKNVRSISVVVLIILGAVAIYYFFFRVVLAIIGAIFNWRYTYEQSLVGLFFKGSKDVDGGPIFDIMLLLPDSVATHASGYTILIYMLHHPSLLIAWLTHVFFLAFLLFLVFFVLDTVYMHYKSFSEMLWSNQKSSNEFFDQLFPPRHLIRTAFLLCVAYAPLLALLTISALLVESALFLVYDVCMYLIVWLCTQQYCWVFISILDVVILYALYLYIFFLLSILSTLYIKAAHEQYKYLFEPREPQG